MNGPDGKAIHAELTLRGTTLMLGPEMARWVPQCENHRRLPDELVSADREGNKTVGKAVKLGAVLKGPVMDMFWGDRWRGPSSSEVIFGCRYHMAELTPKEMQRK